MKVLVTGAAGYTGSVLTHELLKKGHDVVGVDNFTHNQPSLLHCIHEKNLNLVRGDVRDKDLMKRLIDGADFIIPLAAVVGASACNKDPIAARSINLDAIKLILDLRKDKQKIIFPNTNSGYGIGQKDIYCDENTPLTPISLYSHLKVDAEKAILDAGNSITFRLATVFGISPRMRLDLLVNDFVYRAVNDGFLVLFEAHFKRNFVHIRDVANAFIYAMNNFENMKGEPYNFGLSDANLSKLELCNEIKKQIPKFYFVEAEIGEDPDKRNYIVSNAKIENKGLKAEISLKEGISELIKGYQIIKRTQYSNL